MILSSFQLSVEKPNQRRPNNQSKQYNDNINNWELQGKTSNLPEVLENTNDEVVIVFSFASDKWIEWESSISFLN